MSLPKDLDFPELVQKFSTSLETKSAFESWISQVQTALVTRQNSSYNNTFLDLSSTIPRFKDAGSLSLSALDFLLLSHGVGGGGGGSSISTFDILRCYTHLWLGLPETIKTFQDQDATPIFQKTLSRVKSSIGSLPSLFPSESDVQALLDPTTQRFLTHRQLSSFIRDFKFPILHDPDTANSKPVIVIALPNGYLLGLAVLTVSSYCTSAPLNISGGATQFRAEAELANPKAILVLEADIEKLGLKNPWVAEAGIQILVMEPDVNTGLTFSVRNFDNDPESQIANKISPNSPDDHALLLFTSGTSGTKKRVPVTCLELLTGVTCVIDSWGLTPEDSCVNMMPLNHVGGIVRNLFAPVLSGGSTILCPAFDPNLFWDIIQEGQGTWYYASPSMHMSILAEGSIRGKEALRLSKVRLVCNAAGGLLPALAVRLRDTFDCIVLPSYGMTECMPISTPPLNYTLDRPGTSGIACGPEIAILDDDDNLLPPGQVGRINVRGGPCFGGYLKDGKIDTSIFNKAGWFDTGDLGSLCPDGYLYLTGRGKEVINRGGELISPFEIEEAITLASQHVDSSLYKRVTQVMAFSAPHQLLQEVVGVAIVTPSGMPRPDVRDLTAALKSSLHSSKLPVIVVYINALPTSNNKIVRIKFGERLGLEPITADTTLIERHFEAVCPPINSLLTTKVAKTSCTTDIQAIINVVEKHLAIDLESYVGLSHHDGTPEVFLAPMKQSPTAVTPFPSGFMIEILRTRLKQDLDGFLFPSKIEYLDKPFPRHPSGIVDAAFLEKMLKESHRARETSPPASETEHQIRRIFSEVLGFDIDEISSSTDFFEMGGDSLSAGRLLSIIRRDLGARIPVDVLFGSSQVSKLCECVDRILLQTKAMDSDQDDGGRRQLPGCTKTYSSTNPLVLIVNLLPIMLFFPMKIGFRWTVLMYALSQISSIWDERYITSKFLGLIGSMFISRACTQIVSPILGITFKWLVIGRYKEGMYPMWGPYHTRWWIVQKVLLICGKGVFRHLDSTRLLYYKALGAKIGKGVTIEPGTTLGEYDLLEIGDYVHLNQCVCRPFAAERNTSMYLGKIVIGKHSTIGLKAHVAAGSVLPDDTFIGANSSSYEADNPDDVIDRTWFKMPKPHILMELFAIIPIQVVVLFVSSLPWMAGLWGIVSHETKAESSNVRSIIIWWATPHRIIFHYIAQSMHIAVRPFIWIALVIAIKKIIDLLFGKAQPLARDQWTQRDNFRTYILSTLVPNGSLKSFTKLFGTHYDVTSMVMRAMGAKVGKRVYWPGTGPVIQDFDLVQIGDDVVFGSRSYITTSDAYGSDNVQIGNSVMVADRVVLSPGAVVGDRAVLGSGAFIRRDQNCFPDTVWVGNRSGSALCLSNTSAASSAAGLSKSPTFVNIANSKYPEKSSIFKEMDLGISSESSIMETPDKSQRSFDMEKGDCIPSKIRITARTRTLTFESDVSLDDSQKSLDLEKGEKIFPKVGINEVSGTNASSGTVTPVLSENTNSSATTPFGRAFYEGKAPYYVLGQFPIFIYSTFIAVFVQLYWNVGVITTIMLAQIISHSDKLRPHWYRPFKIYAIDVALLSGTYTVLSILAIFIVVAAKWILLGRRKKGSYNWDESSYCQRWQLFLTIESIRNRAFGGHGILRMLTGTWFCSFYYRLLGANIGKDCALFAGGRPSLTLTEPDLLELGDRVAIDDASLVCHLNSRGHFTLNNSRVGSRSVLRSGSRLLSGATMGEDSALLEHTLIMSGDVADDGVTYQGWPADVYIGNRLTGTRG